MNNKSTTPSEEFPALARELGVKKIFFKREDKHPHGSHKGRSIPFMIDKGLEKGAKVFAISSSGNAAISASKYISELNSTREIRDKIYLSIFVGKHIDEAKFAILKELAKSDSNISISVSERPLKSLIEAEKAGSYSLRQSTNKNALMGYKTLAEELADLPHISAIFIPTSSGTTALGIGEFFLGKPPVNRPQIHIVQTSKTHPIAEHFDTSFKNVDSPGINSVTVDTPADAIVDKVAFRKADVIEMINKTNGSGWIPDNSEIIEAQELLKKYTKENITGNGALSLAGLIKAVRGGKEWDGNVVCIISGK